MNFYHFGVSENLEKDMFKKSFEIMESYRKKEEVHAPGGWQVCCLFGGEGAADKGVHLRLSAR